MLIVRPIQNTDFEALMQVAKDSGHGFTSLPVNEELIANKISRAVDSFAKQTDKAFDETYLFVMEDTSTGQVVGTCGIEAAVGMVDAFYHYRLGTEVYYSSQIDVRNEVETLTLCHDYTGASELCSLFLSPEYRQGANGRLLSRTRFLFLAQHPQRFGETVIAEMRGICDSDGHSPFYDWLQTNFLGIDFLEADYLSGLGKKSFMGEMMPRSPIYVPLLPEKARAVIGEVHPDTLPALKLLQAEGFRQRGYVDIFDGGPTVECQLNHIQGVSNSLLMTSVLSTGTLDTKTFIVANTQCEGFRATVAKVELDLTSQTVGLDDSIFAALNIRPQDPVRILAI